VDPEILSAAKQNLERVLDHLGEGIIAHDTKRRITFFNREAERITGWSRANVLDRDCHEVFGAGLCGGKCSFLDGCETFCDSRTSTIEIIAWDGTPRLIESTIVPMRDAEGRLVGALNTFHDVTEIHDLRRRAGEVRGFAGIIGADHKMLAIYDVVRQVAKSDFPVLIQGESGTGKELVANAIHSESQRAGHAFVPVNCGALPEGTLESELFGHVRGAFTGAIRDKKGRFEIADGGTIFLDEVAELSPITQVKLLRVLQEGTFERVGGEHTIRVNSRVISATNKDLRESVAAGRFREDLFYRLCVIPIHLPALRERRMDIPLLAEHFLRLARERAGAGELALSPAVISAFLDYSWPGNIRELQNAIHYALVKCDGTTIEPRHLPPEVVNPVSRALVEVGQSRTLDARSVREALDRCGGNRTKAAKLLGISRATLYRLLGKIPTVS